MFNFSLQWGNWECYGRLVAGQASTQDRDWTRQCNMYLIIICKNMSFTNTCACIANAKHISWHLASAKHFLFSINKMTLFHKQNQASWGKICLFDRLKHEKQLELKHNKHSQTLRQTHKCLKPLDELNSQRALEKPGDIKQVCPKVWNSFTIPRFDKIAFNCAQVWTRVYNSVEECVIVFKNVQLCTM